MRVNYKYDIANASKEKHEKWAKLERMNIQNKVDDIKSRAKEIGELSDWDIEAIAKVEKVLQDENRKQFERDIGEILKLAGLHSEFKNELFTKNKLMLGKEKMTNNRQLQASMNDWIDEVIDGENEGVFVTLNFTQKKLGKTAIKATITHEEAAKIIKAFCRKIDGLFFSKRAIDKQEVLQVGLKRICFYEDGKFGNLHWHSLLFANSAELLAMRAKLLWQNMDKLKKLDVERSRFDVLRTANDIKKVAYYCIKDVRKNGLQNFDLANTRLAEKLAVA